MFSQNTILRKLDNLSMKYGIEYRTPLYDRILFEYVTNNYDAELCGKTLLKQFLSKEEKIQHKYGFSTPLHIIKHHCKRFLHENLDILQKSLGISSALSKRLTEYEEWLLVSLICWLKENDYHT